MDLNKISKVAAKKAVDTLNLVLRADANSTSCMLVYQPKAPRELSRFRKDKC